MNLHIDGLEAGKYREIRPEETKRAGGDAFLRKNQKEGREEAMNESSIKRMKELGEKLREASRAYYQEDREIMTKRGVRRPVRRS